MFLKQAGNRNLERFLDDFLTFQKVKFAFTESQASFDKYSYFDYRF